MIRIRIFLTTFLSMAILLASAQEKSITLKHITVEDGLSDNQVTCILRDNFGFIWVGTKDGLNRFDGNEFYVFKNNPDNPNSICGNNIKCIELGADSLLWIGTTNNGFCSYDSKTGKFETYNKDNSLLVSNSVNDLCFDAPKNILWIGLNNFGLQTFDLKTKRISNNPKVISGNTYYDIEHKDTIAYYAGIGESLKRIEFIGKFKTDVQKAGATINKILIGSDKNIWCGAWDNGLHQFNANAQFIKTYFFDGSNNLKQSGDEIISVAEDENKILWCGTKSSGVLFFDLNTKKFTKQIKVSAPLSSRINYIYKDNFNRMWLATEAGLYVYDPLQNQLQTVILPVPDGVTSCKVNDRIILPSGKEFIATQCGLFFKNKLDKTYSYKEIFYRKEKQELTSIFLSEQNIIYVGTNRTVFTLDTNTIQFSTIVTNKETQKEDFYFKPVSRVNSITAIKHNSQSYIAVSFYGHYTALINPVRKNIVYLLPDTLNKAIFFDNLPRKLFVDSKNNFWFCGATNGVTKLLMPEGNSIDSYERGDSLIGKIYIKHKNWGKINSGNLKNINNAFDIIENNDGSFWVSTQGNGLVKFFPESDSLPFISYANNSNSLQGLARASDGNLWIITSAGLLHFNTHIKRYKLFDASNGLMPNVSGYFFQDNKSNRASTLAAGFDGGFVSFNSQYILTDKEKPNVVVSRLWVMDGSMDSLLFDKIQLSHNNNFLKLYMSSNCFSNNEQVTYQYQLEGIDDIWRSNQNNSLVTYTSLPPGNFLFRYKSINSDGLESDIKSLAIVIKSPFYKTWYFYLLITAAIISLIFVIYKIRINQVLKLQTVRNKIARDLHDDIGSTLGSINLYSQIANVKLQQNELEEIKTILNKIGISSREIIDKTGDAVWAVKASNDSLKNLVLRMESFAATLLGSANINFTIDYNEIDFEMKLEMIQRKNIFLIFKEAIHNIIKYANCSEVRINIKRIAKKIHIEIKDNGKGFNTLTLNTNMDVDGLDVFYNGNGIKNMKSRAEEIGGSFVIYSEKDKGTIIIIIV